MSNELAETNGAIGANALAELLGNQKLIAQLKERYAGVADLEKLRTKEGYEAGRIAKREFTSLRTTITKRGKELRREAIDFQKTVIATEKQLIEGVLEVEEPIRALMEEIDLGRAREHARLAAEVEAKRVADAKRLIDEENLKIKESQDAENARLARVRAELEANQKAIDEEKARLATVRAEQEAAAKALEDKQLIERNRLEAQRIAQVAEKERLERIEFERLAKIEADAKAAQQAEYQRVMQEKAERDRAEAERLRKAEADSRRPDEAKMSAYAQELASVPAPQMQTTWGQMGLTRVQAVLSRIRTEFCK